MGQAEKAQRLLELHHGQTPVVFVNVWDAASACIVEQAGFPAIATSSAGLANALGCPDGQKLQWHEMLAAIRRISNAVRIPVIVNGGVETAGDVRRAFDETGCAGVMIGRAALNHPWIFREVRQLRRGEPVTLPSVQERLDLCRRHLGECVSARGERRGVLGFRKHLQGYLSGVPGGMELRRTLLSDETMAGNMALIDAHEERLR